MTSTTYMVGVGDVAAADAGQSRFSYDATDARNKRKAPATALLSEDKHADKSKRKSLTANSRDLVRNYAVVGWAVRKHLDFVASHTLHIRSPDRGLNREVAAMFAEWGDECDVQGRLDFDEFTRLCEARRTVDGDIGIVYYSPSRGGYVQGIESERIADPEQPRNRQNREPSEWMHGVRTNRSGRAIEYAIHRRGSAGKTEFERTISAANFHLLGYFDRFDQRRGISPMAPAMNSFRDSYETQDLAIAQAKVAKMFGLVLYREADDAPAPTEEESGSENDTGQSRYQVDFGQGPIMLDLDPGDRAEFLKNESAAVDHAQMIKLTLQLAILSLDLPYCFLDPEASSYGWRAAMLLYQKSAKKKRRGLCRFLKRTQRWKLAQWLSTGQLVFPRTVDPRQLILEWVPDGIPWWDPSKETRADLMAIGAGLKTRTEVRRERYGDDWLDVMDELAHEQQVIDQHRDTSGLVLMDLAKSDDTTGPGSGNSETSDNTGEARK